MTVYFTETEAQSEDFFESSLPDVDVGFAEDIAAVPAAADCVSVFIGSQITAEVFAAHPNVRFIATRSTGTDHIDLTECRKRGVIVSSVPSYGENTVAEHTFALLLAISRRIRPAL